MVTLMKKKKNAGSRVVEDKDYLEPIFDVLLADCIC